MNFYVRKNLCVGLKIVTSFFVISAALSCYYWPAEWAIIVLLAVVVVVVCSAAVVGTLPAIGPAGRVDGRRAGGRARGNRVADTARRASVVMSR